MIDIQDPFTIFTELTTATKTYCASMTIRGEKNGVITDRDTDSSELLCDINNPIQHSRCSCETNP